MSVPPAVYILHGDDEVGIEDWIGSIREKMGERSTADMNTARLSGRVDLRELNAAVRAVPFLAERRLVVLEAALGALRGKNDRAEFLDFLAAVPESTALVIVESTVLKSDHWLITWAEGHRERVYKRAMPLPRGGALVKWVVDYTRTAGGEMTVQAAQHLVNLVGDDNRLAAEEADKLLAYVNYDRPIEVDDVDLLTAPIRQADVFKMVDALGARNGRLSRRTVSHRRPERKRWACTNLCIRKSPHRRSISISRTWRRSTGSSRKSTIRSKTGGSNPRSR
jgi:DNA polymerase-3 subunit delta